MSSPSLQALGPLRGTDADPFEGAEVDANALGWALAVVTSRAFRTRGPGQVRRRPLPAELVGPGEGGAPMSLRWTLCVWGGVGRGGDGRRMWACRGSASPS